MVGCLARPSSSAACTFGDQRQLGGLDALHGNADAVRCADARYIGNGGGRVWQPRVRMASLRIRDAVFKGIGLAEALRQLEFRSHQLGAEFTGLFPSLLVQMIDLGEQSGSLSALLGKAADAQDEALEQQVHSLTQLIEPLLVVVLGGLVGGMVIALYLPVFQLGQVM